MRVLLDEHLNWRLARAFGSSYEVRSVRGMGWTGKHNGVLLSAAAQEFDVMLSMDRGLEHQQRLSDYDLAVVLLIAPSNRLEDTVTLIPDLERLSAGVKPGCLLCCKAHGSAKVGPTPSTTSRYTL